MRKYLIVAAMILSVLCLLASCGKETVFEYSGEGDFVTLIITDDEGNTMLEEQKVGIREGATVLDCTRYLLQKNKMQYEVTGAGSAVYMRGIDNLYERDKGPQSGWLYRVNGSFDDTSKSCGVYTVENGDRIEWVYTLNLGADVGAQQNGD